MAKKCDKETLKLRAMVESLQAKNADLGRSLSDAKKLLEQGGAIVQDLEAKLDAAGEACHKADEHAAWASMELEQVRAECERDVDLARHGEQVAKGRVARAEKVAQRLWKALGILDADMDGDGKIKFKDVEGVVASAKLFRDVHVQPDQHGVLVLISE